MSAVTPVYSAKSYAGLYFEGTWSGIGVGVGVARVENKALQFRCAELAPDHFCDTPEKCTDANYNQGDFALVGSLEPIRDRGACIDAIKSLDAGFGVTGVTELWSAHPQHRAPGALEDRAVVEAFFATTTRP
jgi:hypothetical protein